MTNIVDFKNKKTGEKEEMSLVEKIMMVLMTVPDGQKGEFVLLFDTDHELNIYTDKGLADANYVIDRIKHELITGENIVVTGSTPVRH